MIGYGYGYGYVMASLAHTVFEGRQVNQQFHASVPLTPHETPFPPGPPDPTPTTPPLRDSERKTERSWIRGLCYATPAANALISTPLTQPPPDDAGTESASDSVRSHLSTPRSPPSCRRSGVKATCTPRRAVSGHIHTYMHI